MLFETVKLKELNDSEIVSFPDGYYTITVSELKERIKNGTSDGKEWYVVKQETWTPHANYMIENYIENEYQELYEGWYERAKYLITDESIQQIQKILDKMFDDPYVKNYWTLEKRIEI